MTVDDCPPLADRITKSLLGYGVIAGPFYLAVAAAQIVLRDGYDPTRHAVSQLANGDFGWVQTVNFLLSGAMTVAAAVGIGRALRPDGLAGWAAALVGGYGVGLIAAGILRADPSDGFPPGTPAGAGTVSGHGIGHLAAAGIGLACLVAAGFVLAAWFARHGAGGWAWSSRGVATFVGVAFLAMASGARGAPPILAFTAAVIVSWGWLTAVSLRLYRTVGRPVLLVGTPD